MTRPDFEEQILRTLGEIDRARPQQLRRDLFREVLERFAKTLSKHPAIGSAVETIAQVPGGLRLITWPKLRRDERTVMLVFARQGEPLVVLGSPGREFRTPDELEAYLSQDFLRASAFPDTLALYEERCAMPTTGFLRQGGPNEIKPGDVLVHLDPEEQRRLATTEPGQEVSVLAREDRLPSDARALPREGRSPLTGLYDSAKTYVCLVAGGYGLWALFCSREEEGGRLRIAGPVMSDQDLG